VLKEFYEIDLETGMIIENHVMATQYEDKDGNVITVEIPPNYKEGWGVNRSFYNPIFDIEKNDWVEGKSADEILSIAKEKRFRELSIQCQDSILGYFKAIINEVEYEFSFDREAQSNFTGTLHFFSNGLIENVEWTAWKDGVAERLILDEVQFMNIAKLAFTHKNQKISKLRNELQPQLDACQTIEELELITWI
jgi:hypothetical protein